MKDWLTKVYRFRTPAFGKAFGTLGMSLPITVGNWWCDDTAHYMLLMLRQ